MPFMKKTTFLYITIGLFAIISCKKNSDVSTANATFTFHQIIALDACNSPYRFKIDDVPDKTFLSKSLPADFRFPLRKCIPRECLSNIRVFQVASTMII